MKGEECMLNCKCCREFNVDLGRAELEEDHFEVKIIGGHCEHLDPKTNICKVYDKRPQVCIDFECPC